MEIQLNINNGFSWFVKNNLFFKGYFYIENSFFKQEEALNFLLKTKDFKALLKKINGVFTIIKKSNHNTIVITDITRSFPVFYTQTKNSWCISDDIYALQKQNPNVKFNKNAELEFLASNHVHGKKTLLNTIYQTQSAEYLEFSSNVIKEQSFYFSYSTKNQNNKPIIELKKECFLAFENSFKRCLNSIEKNQIIVPLSSGLDSRLIAVLLKKYNHKNVLCYTYGKKDSFEINYSKKTAETLNFSWIFIEYNDSIIRDFLKTKPFKKYIEYAGKLTSMPNLQEYFAVQYLHENNFVEKDAIFISGYAGDILGGSEYKFYDNPLKNNKLSNIIFRNKMSNFVFSDRDKNKTLQDIEQNLVSFDSDYKQKIPETVLDNYNIKERIAKYIFNSASFYTFFGYTTRFPFWDKELLCFFKELPIDYKRDKSFFDTVLNDYYFKAHNVNFDNNTEIKKNRFKQLKSILKTFLPTFIKKKRLEKRDWNNYRIITLKMLEQLKNRNVKVFRLYKDYNEIITQWYLYLIKNKL